MFTLNNGTRRNRVQLYRFVFGGPQQGSLRVIFNHFPGKPRHVRVNLRLEHGHRVRVPFRDGDEGSATRAVGVEQAADRLDERGDERRLEDEVGPDDVVDVGRDDARVAPVEPHDADVADGVDRGRRSVVLAVQIHVVFAVLLVLVVHEADEVVEDEVLADLLEDLWGKRNFNEHFLISKYYQWTNLNFSNYCTSDFHSHSTTPKTLHLNSTDYRYECVSKMVKIGTLDYRRDDEKKNS